MDTYPIFGIVLESIIEDKVKLLCAFVAFVATTHEMAIHQHYVSIVQSESNNDRSFIPTAAP